MVICLDVLVSSFFLVLLLLQWLDLLGLLLLVVFLRFFDVSLNKFTVFYFLIVATSGSDFYWLFVRVWIGFLEAFQCWSFCADFGSQADYWFSPLVFRKERNHFGCEICWKAYCWF